nr:efflux RND transporter periplasmic adaptor subunit [bacterium]
PISEYIETTNNVYADAHVTVHPKTGGQIVRVLVDEGASVSRGDILAVIDDDEYLLRKRQAEVARRQALEKRDRVQAMYDNRMASQEAFNDAQYAYEDAALALDLAELNLANTRIRSPIDGIVIERLVHPGDLIASTSPAFEIVDPESLMVDVFLPEREAARLKKNMTAVILPDALPGRAFDAVIQRVNPSVDPRTGTVKVTLAFRQNQPELSTGMFVRVQILVEHRDNAVLVPKQAILRRKNQARVFVMTGEGTAERREVQLGLEDITTFEVLSGLAPGERLIVVGQHNLEDGQAVRLLESDA